LLAEALVVALLAGMAAAVAGLVVIEQALHH
jgi:hypothetical protein